VNFNTAKLDKAVADFKALFGTHVQMFQFGQFYVTNRTLRDLRALIEAEIRGNLRLKFATPAELAGVIAFFDKQLSEGVDRVDLGLITSILNGLERDGDLAPIRELFEPSKQDRANAQRDFDALWTGSDIPAAPHFSSSPPTFGKARAAKLLENDRCFQVLRSMSSKTLRARAVTALPAGVSFSAGAIGGAVPVETTPASAGQVPQQTLAYSVTAQLAVGIQRMKAAVDAGGQVHCGVLSGARHENSKFPQPEHHVLVLAHDQIDGRDVFLFWDPDAAQSNIVSTHWGQGFGVLIGSATRLSTAIDEADLKAIDLRKTLPTGLANNDFGNHLSEPRRHCYQVYFVQTLPMAATVKVRTTVLDPPKRASMDDMLRNATALFAEHDIEIIEASREAVATTDDDLDRFRTVFVGDGGDSPTSDIDELHAALRGDTAGLGVEPEPGDIVVAVVQDIVPAASGSNRHPVEQPGVVLSAALAGPWTLAHQLGHVLGLDDAADPGSLMFGGSDPDVGADPPVLSAAEAQTVRDHLSAPA
jgi:hypothetical protein